MADSSGPGLGQPSAPTDLGPVLIDLAAVLAALAAIQADIGDPSVVGTDLDEILRTGYNSAGIVPNLNGSVHEILKFITGSLIPDVGGLVFSGTCDAGMAGSQTAIVCADLAGYGDDLFNDKYYMYIIRNTNAVGTAPEMERRLVTNYVSATGTFTTDPFTANVEATDSVLVIHQILVDTRDLSQGTFDMVNGELELQETNWDVTMDGTEMDLWTEASPQGAMEPLVLLVDLDALADGDRIIIREKYREEKGEGEVQLDTEIFEGADGGLEDDNKKIEIDLKPNRHGYSITAEQDLGTNRTLPCEIFRRA